MWQAKWDILVKAWLPETESRPTSRGAERLAILVVCDDRAYGFVVAIVNP